MSRDDFVLVTARFLVGTSPDSAVLRVHDKIRANMDRIPVGIPEPRVVGRGIDDVAIVSLTLTPAVGADNITPAALTRVARELQAEVSKLTNLLRNALQALVEKGSRGDARVGFRVHHRTDEITGLLRAAVAVLDSAEGSLSSAMFLEAEVGRGLGLVRDLVERNGGTVRVTLEPGWSKAVVVELNRVEDEVLA